MELTKKTHTMTLNQSALLELTDVLRTAEGGQVMRLMLSAMLQALVDAEATAPIGSDPYEAGVAPAVLSTLAVDSAVRSGTLSEVPLDDLDLSRRLRTPRELVR
jgi:hypothetical protein